MSLVSHEAYFLTDTHANIVIQMLRGFSTSEVLSPEFIGTEIQRTWKMSTSHFSGDRFNSINGFSKQ